MDSFPESFNAASMRERYEFDRIAEREASAKQASFIRSKIVEKLKDAHSWDAYNITINGDVDYYAIDLIQDELKERGFQVAVNREKDQVKITLRLP